jgi:hypothetical protein
MKFAIQVHGWVRAAARLCGGGAIEPCATRAQTAKVIRLSGPVVPRSGRGPVLRWSLNPVSGRLECRWMGAGESVADRSGSSRFERFGIIHAIHQRARSLH